MIEKHPELEAILKSKYSSLNIPLDEINIFGIRYDMNQEDDVWNDKLGIMTANNIYLWIGTTDPGKKATKTSEKGAAHLCLGYHKNIWQVGIHGTHNPNFAHNALVQTGNKVKIWRDKNKDFKENDGFYDEGYFGINFHRASKVENVLYIGPFSAGCQVTQDVKDFEFAMNLIMNSEKYKNNNKCCFSYMLFDYTEIGL